MKDIIITTRVSDGSTSGASEPLGGATYVGIPNVYEGLFGLCWPNLLDVDDDS
jgi:hypothetical protein